MKRSTMIVRPAARTTAAQPASQQAAPAPRGPAHDTRPDIAAQLRSARRQGHSFSALGGGDRAPIQAKLTIGAPDDAYEREAEQVARAVMRTSAPPAPADGAAGPPQPQAPPAHEGLKIRALRINAASGAGTVDAPPAVTRQITAMRGQGRPLDDTTRAGLEPRFGADFGRVRVHSGGAAAALNQALGARAFTAGRDIFFGRGEYHPASGGRRRLLAHELAHVVQQAGEGREMIQRMPRRSPGRNISSEDERNRLSSKPTRFPLQGNPSLPRSQARTPPLPALDPSLSSVPPENALLPYVPTRVPEMTDEEYKAYVARSKRWMEAHESRDLAELKVGDHLYHGTSREVAKIVADKGLKPADPNFRQVPRTGHRWDASRDGFLSMAKELEGVTLLPRSVILRMQIAQGDLENWGWKKFGGASEVVSTLPIPPGRLEWSENKKDWHDMSKLL